MKFLVEITITLPKKSKSEKISAVISASTSIAAISRMIDGIFSDPSRKGTTVWYREYSKKAYPKGYQKPEKRLLLSAIREDAVDYPEAKAFPPNFHQPRITVEIVKEEPKPEEPKSVKEDGDRQTKLFAQTSYTEVILDYEIYTLRNQEETDKNQPRHKNSG